MKSYDAMREALELVEDMCSDGRTEITADGMEQMYNAARAALALAKKERNSQDYH